MENLEEELESEPPLHKNSYSTYDIYCKYQLGCEGYTDLCRLGETTPKDCRWAEKIIKAERIKQMKGRKV